MAAPGFQAAGTVVRGTGTVTPAWPTHITNDVALLIVETAHQAATLSDAQGFVEGASSPQGTGTAGTSAATRLTWFWKRATANNMAAPTVADSGDHQTAVIVTFRGCITTGNPWDVTAGGVQASAQTGFSIPTVTTTVDEALMVLLLSNNGDAATNEMTLAPVNANLTNITERVDTQPIPVSQQTAMLRLGPYGGMMGLVGAGPGGDFGNPYYRFCGFNPHDDPSQLQAMVEAAETNDVTIFVLLANSPPNYGSNSTGFLLGTSGDAAGAKTYWGQLNKLAAMAGWPALQAAFLSGRAVAYVGDEPYHAKWTINGVQTWTPALVNAACAAVKTLVGGPVLTVMRADIEKLASGWGGSGTPTSTTWNKLDYGTMQYEGPQAKSGNTFAQQLAAVRALASPLNIGVFPTLNLWAGGNHATIAGVARSWDYLNNGVSSGVIAGAVQNANSPYALGQFIPATTYDATPTASTLVASPAWIRECINEVYDDQDIPWFGLWTYSRPSLNIDPWAGDDGLQTRSDYLAALDYAVNKALTRPAANVLRTPKA